MHTPDAQTEPPPASAPRAGLSAWAIGPAFLVAAGWLFFFSPGPDIPVDEMRIVSRELFAPGAPRQRMGDDPVITVGGFRHSCNECHRLFDSPPVERRILMQHTHIARDHGMNNRCFNCHDREDREKLVLQDGTRLGFDEVPRLCSQCHGTLFRDWQRGMHGKTMGSWDAASGAQVRLLCIDCHDPHAPAYKGIAPLPGPRTLRMGDQSPVAHESHRHMPLRGKSAALHGPGSSEPTEEVHP